MSLPEHWIPHRREDGELVGWIAPEGEGFVPIDLLGRQRADAPIDWLPAEELLEELGIGYLAEIYALRREDGEWIRARIVEASPDGIGVAEDDLGDIGAVVERFRLPFPLDDRLVLLADAPGPVRGPFG
ncbi:hypothetical protein MUN78_10685 [Leucobacter allii]|uniref:S1 motif domain-containing protein n=1 Tax=Leucobacter allii TaxID=2932247 RepID=A0ABY4FJ84_9MICO|nr:hypothetical protein [Leucobacter allii]UOQ56161.1 hypothetical protein MUN78_10685 [Leucobacter allii]UOR00629.1 hypothetical protein MUN77_10690 [Leucobacter allii]